MILILTVLAFHLASGNILMCLLVISTSYKYSEVDVHATEPGKIFIIYLVINFYSLHHFCDRYVTSTGVA